jgi:hypothetical protein
LWLCGLLAGFSVSAHTVRSPWLDKHYIEHSFYDIALQAEYRSERVPSVVKRWAGPLRVWMYSGAGDARRPQALLKSHFQHLAQLTRLPVRFVDRESEANVRVYFAADDELGELARSRLSPMAYRELDRSVCISTIRFNRRSEIIRGSILIPVRRARKLGKLEACVVEEATQMLGLINDSKSVRHTVFSDITDDDQLTGLDYLLIKLLYSPYLRSGMDLRQVAPQVRHQLDLWELSGELQRADRLAASRLRLAGR